MHHFDDCLLANISPQNRSYEQQRLGAGRQSAISSMSDILPATKESLPDEYRFIRFSPNLITVRREVFIQLTSIDCQVKNARKDNLCRDGNQEKQKPPRLSVKSIDCLGYQSRVIATLV